MDGVSAISGYGSMAGLSSAGQTSGPTQMAGSADDATSTANAGGTVGASSAAGSSITMTSLQQSSESLLMANQSTAAPVSNELLGAILLMLLLKFLESNNPDEQKGLLSAMGTMAQAQQGGQSQSSLLMYSSSSLSIGSLTVQTVSPDAAAGAYNNAAVAPGDGSNGSGGSLNVTA